MENRFKEARKAKGKTLKQIGDLLNISESAVSNIERGRNKPSGSTLTLFCEKLHINKEWLESGKGEMFVAESDTDDVIIERFVRRYTNGSTVFRALAKTYLKLDDEHQKAFDDYVIEFLQNYNEEKAESMRAETLALAQRQIDIEAKDTKASESI